MLVVDIFYNGGRVCFEFMDFWNLSVKVDVCDVLMLDECY